ncbi:MAG: flippase-like domain-containing protein [Bacteroidales bacterium]|nr:flippase-like domain-containing protein [Bacteroidales bacterium]
MDKIVNSLKPSRIIFPILIGLGVSAWLLFRNFDPDSFDFVKFTGHTVLFIFIAFVMMFVRDVSYMYRIIVLTDSRLSWKQAFNIIMLWEFSSAVSPSVVGGTAPAIFFLYKEGISVGKSTAVVLTAIFLDEVFFIVSVPLVYLFYGNQIFPPESKDLSELIYGFYLGYGIIFVYTGFLAYALFINPYLFKTFVSWVFLFPVLRKWRLQTRKYANQLIRTSKLIKGKKPGYWIKSMLATIFSWTGRYWVVNFLLMAFFVNTGNLYDQFLIYGRQLTMWIILLISPTPGGSGIAEYIFTDFLRDFIPDASWGTTLAIFWRLISYYPYLFIGVIILPIWIRHVYKKSKKYKKVD